MLEASEKNYPLWRGSVLQLTFKSVGESDYLLPNNYINYPSGAFFSQISTSEVPEQLGAPVRRGGGSAVGDQTELHSETDHPNHHHKHFPQWPDTVYYHSYTTPYMGWKIHVIDSFRFLIYLMRS